MHILQRKFTNMQEKACQLFYLYQIDRDPTLQYNIMKLFRLATLIILLTTMIQVAQQKCSHPIFCNETILEAVANKTTIESKEFVDMVLKVPIDKAIEIFEEANNNNISDFIQKCFTDAQSILQKIEKLPGWQESPKNFQKISPSLKSMAIQLNKRWNELARKVNLNYKTNGQCIENCSSFLPGLHGRTIIMPGGRFRQSYYWDTYWIIKGLIACNMLQVAEHLVRNFIIVLNEYGFIPNGFRVYYLNRSQPPFFSLMVKQVAQAYRMQGNKVQADQLQADAFDSLVNQQKYWMSTHNKQYTLKSGRVITLNRYYASTTSPRPEGYRKDQKQVQNVTDAEQVKRILRSFSTMAESGWDFSSRWLSDQNDLKTSVITEMIPSDLNMLMGLLESYLSTLSARYGRIDLLSTYQQILKDRKQYFNQIFTGQVYPDTYPASINKQNRRYPSDYYPYLMFSTQNASINKVYTSEVNPNSSLVQTQQQWDAPNVWAPNNWILHEVVSSVEALSLAQQWISTVQCSMNLHQGKCFQKYMSSKLGESGTGGEYEGQDGFGWTNGLALYYLVQHTQKIVPTKACQGPFQLQKQ